MPPDAGAVGEARGRRGRKAVCWNSCGGLGGNARFTMVSRGPSPPSSGNCDFFLFPERTYYGDVPHSYTVEFKHLKKGAKRQELEAQRKEGIAQLKRYAKDKKGSVQNRNICFPKYATSVFDAGAAVGENKKRDLTLQKPDILV